MNCPYCNEEIGQNQQDNFCLICGHRLVRCSTCGEILTKRIKFCPKDGTKVPEELLEELPAAEAVAAAAGVKKAEPVKKAATVKKTQISKKAADVNKTQPIKKAAAVKQTEPVKKAEQAPKKMNPVKKDSGGNKSKPLVLGLLLLLLLVGLVCGGYFAASALLSGNSSDKQSAERQDRVEKSDKEDDDDDDDKKRDNEDTDDKKDESEDSSVDEKKKDTEEAVAFDGEAEGEEKDSETDKKEADKKESGTEEKKTDDDSKGVAFTPEKQEASEITAKVSKANSSSYSGLSKAKITSSSSSSVVTDNDPSIKNEAAQMVDGSEVTSWQEGATGDGIGEWVQFIFKKEYNVKYITFKMGNWRDQTRYDKNNRPQSVLIRMGGQEYNLTFPDGKNEYMVELSDSLPASDLYLEIRSVYKGSDWDDTCISEMTIYTE